MAAVARGKGRPKRTEAAEIDQAIRTAALAILLEHGESATVNAVAQAAGLSRKSLYARYPNKGELFFDVIRELLENAEALQYDAAGSTEDRLRHYIEAALASISRPGAQALQRLLRLDPGYIGALRDQMLAATRKIFFAPLAALLTEAAETGAFAVEDVDATARAVIRMIFAEGITTGPDAEPGIARAPQQDYAAFLTQLLTRGLTPRG